MKIVLLEERRGQQPAERAFDLETLKVGRDPSICQVVFDQTEWPMVSRQHAEFRLRQGRCQIVDTNSSFGTFLNGNRVTEPTPVEAGAQVQFGAGGPILRVVEIGRGPSASATPAQVAGHSEMETRRDPVTTLDQEAITAQTPVAPTPTPPPQKRVTPPAPTPKPVPAQTPQQPQQPRQPQSPARTPTPARTPAPAPAGSHPVAPAQVALVELVHEGTGNIERIPLAKEIMRLGRDPEMDVALDAASAVVSRRHAEIHRQPQGQQYVLFDLGSFNGTLVNEQRITQPVPLFDGDRLQLGMGGPILRFIDPAHPAPAGAHHAGQRVVSGVGEPAVISGIRPVTGPIAEVAGMSTVVFKPGTDSLKPQTVGPGGAPSQLLMQRLFEGRPALTIGRAPDNDIKLDGLQISNHHARVLNTGGQMAIEDVGSTNGVYVNGERVSGRRALQNREIVQIGPFMLQADAQHGVSVFDARSKTRIDAIDITKIVTNRSGGGKIKLLDDVDLTINPNEFVGLLGPSGAGKSTLMDSLNGMRPASSGHVLINNLDLYQHLDSLKHSIGYVPQDDIIHRELTVYRTLYYVARLRLSRDVSTQEIDQIVNEVMDVTGLAERRDVPVGQLSGGQRKRVSIAVELITKPSVIFLDEPTSGLDPATEEKIMKLFRQIAESGRTVILTTHAMENVRLFDKIVVMMRGKLVFYGSPKEALAHLKADSFKDLYDKLEGPIDEQISKLPPLPPAATREQQQAFKHRKEEISEAVAEEWKHRFQQTEIYQRNIVRPLSGMKRDAQAVAPVKRRPTVTDSVRQWGTLARRYIEVLGRDKFNLLILFGQAPIIALLTYLVVGEHATRDFPFFMVSLVAIWFGTSVSAREIIRERAVYNRERMVNLGLLPYVASKLFVLSLIVGLQCVLLFGTLKLFDFAGLMKLPGVLFGIPQLLLMILTGIVGIGLGLFISAIVKTGEMATSLVPLILIPQILFSGLVGVPSGVSKVVGLAMPATWAFDEMKQLSQLDTVSEEGSDENGPNHGRGLKKHTEDLNDQNLEKARKDVENYKNDAEESQKDFEQKMNDYVRNAPANPALEKPTAPSAPPAPKVPEAVKVPEDLSNYVEFLHPWGHVLLDPLVLLLMFFGLIIAAIMALRAQDIG
jgi:ABC-type multidrug transport system ATPase subunit/pSer/pThr/pTyr-binding forkhead associated (FHA) protein